MQPRRIPDYPDAFKGWNEVSSYGSIVSVFSTIIFGIVLYRSFVSDKLSSSSNAHWSWLNFWTPVHITNSAPSCLPTSMEWVLRSPTPHHSYDDPVIE